MTIEDITFVQQHLQADTKQLWLKYGKTKETLIQQVEARQKVRQKLPNWYAELSLLFPVGVSVEQSSSEVTAQYKASIIAEEGCPSCLIDATGGMGIDSFFFAKNASKVIYLERNEALVQTAQHNFEVLGATNITCHCTDSVVFLEALSVPVEWIYLDPARRAGENRRVVALSDCEPDIPRLLPILLQKTRRILIKAAPLLDLTQALIQLPQTRSVHVVAVENECKELLFQIEASCTAPSAEGVMVKTINFKKDGFEQRFEFEWQYENHAEVSFDTPQQYIYEPNAAVLKAGAFKTVGVRYALAKIAPHSHLYTSSHLIADFPGRCFMLQAVVKADAKTLAPFLKEGKANLTVRNFPATVEELRKKLKIKEGGDCYLFATTLLNGDKRLLVCEKC